MGEVKKHLNSAITITEAAQVNAAEQCVLSLPVTKKFSPDALHEKQLRFYPTKRKRERTQSCTKPTLEEVESTKEKLNNTDVVVCGICFKEDDKCRDKSIEWIQCGRCEIWMHSLCANQCDDNFVCDHCK